MKLYIIILITIFALINISNAYSLDIDVCHMRIINNNDISICTGDKCVVLNGDTINYPKENLLFKDYSLLFGYCLMLGEDINSYQDTLYKLDLLYFETKQLYKKVSYKKIKSLYDFKNQLNIELPIKTFINERDLFLIKDSIVLISSIENEFKARADLIKENEINHSYNIDNNNDKTINTYDSILNSISDITINVAQLKYDSCSVSLNSFKDPDYEDELISWSLSIYNKQNHRDDIFLFSNVDNDYDIFLQLSKASITNLCKDIHNNDVYHKDSYTIGHNYGILINDIRKTRFDLSSIINSKTFLTF